MRRNALTDQFDERSHISGASAIGSLNEVGVLIGHRRRTKSEAAQADPLDELARTELAGNRVDEDRTGVLTAGLMLATPPHDLVEFALGYLAIAVGQLQPRLDHHLMIGQVATAEPKAQMVGCHPAVPTAA